MPIILHFQLIPLQKQSLQLSRFFFFFLRNEIHSETNNGKQYKCNLIEESFSDALKPLPIQ